MNVTGSIPGQRRSVPLKTILQHFLNRIEDKQSSSNDCYEQEFQDLKKFSETLKYSCTEGEKEVNKKKNRYKDILPFDVTRVVLSCGSDYINANYIKGASGSPAYIASQGPLPNTVADFWRMVVQCQVQVIVMACNPHEAGKHKCENYWVEKEGETKTFGCVEIRLIKASNVCSDFLVRTMLITYTNENNVKESRTVCQFHYLAWPDHGVPTLVRPLLDMVRLVRDTQASETLPVLVHCSAGCGRTGTICAIDFVWGLLRLGKMCEDFNLYDLVREMRRQRVAMVQTKEQYMLVHQAVGELLKQQLNLIQSHHYENLDCNGEPIYETIPNHADEDVQAKTSESGKQSEMPRIYDSVRSDISRSREKLVPSKLDTLPIETEKKEEFTWENGEEKKDGNKMEYDEGIKKTLTRSTPPLPRNKWSSPISSKQEKEVENMTEKNRTAAALKPIILPGESPDNSLKRRPKIAKLRALFERSSPNSDKKNQKKASISRSHSLGPIRKPFVTEITKPVEKTAEVEKSKKSEPAVRSGGKLKVPKLLSAPRTVPQVKRSKSLILNKQPTPFLSLLKEATGDGVFGQFSQEGPSQPVENPYGKIPEKKTVTQSESIPGHFESRGGFRPITQRRRSLDSITGDEPPRITWPNVVQHTPQQSLKPKAAMSLRHQLQVLTNASHRTVTSLASGWSLGIRERRNSFRQAISRDIDQFGTEGRFVYVSEDAKDANFAAAGVLVNAQNPYSHHSHLTVRAQNGDILPAKNTSSQQRITSKGSLLQSKPAEDGSERRHNKLTHAGNSPGDRPRNSDTRQWRMSSQSMRLPSNNKFLYRLRSELETKSMSRNQPESKFHIPDQKINRGRESETHRSDGELKTTDILATSPKIGGLGDDKRRMVTCESQAVDRISKDGTNRTDRFIMPVDGDVTDGVRKSRQYHPRDGRDYPSKTINPSRTTVDRGESRTLPPRMSARVFPPLSHYPSKSSSASSQSSDNISDYAKISPKLSVDQPEKRHLRASPLSQPSIAMPGSSQEQRSSRGLGECLREPYSKDRHRIPSEDMLSGRAMDKPALYGRRMYLVEREGSESSSSSGARELIDHMLTPSPETTWASLTRSKSSSDALMEMKSHVPSEPRAPPRVRRRSSTATAPPSLSLTPASRHASGQLMHSRYSSKPANNMKNMGVDVDAVAASMLKTSISTSPPPISDQPHAHASTHNPLTSRKHHYL